MVSVNDLASKIQAGETMCVKILMRYFSRQININKVVINFFLK